MRYNDLSKDATHFIYDGRLYINGDEPGDFETGKKININFTSDSIVEECGSELQLVLEKIFNMTLLMAARQIDHETAFTKILQLTYQVGYLMGLRNAG